jgi:hypothetical protein
MPAPSAVRPGIGRPPTLPGVGTRPRNRRFFSASRLDRTVRRRNGSRRARRGRWLSTSVFGSGRPRLEPARTPTLRRCRPALHAAPEVRPGQTHSSKPTQACDESRAAHDLSCTDCTARLRRAAVPAAAAGYRLAAPRRALSWPCPRAAARWRRLPSSASPGRAPARLRRSLRRCGGRRKPADSRAGRAVGGGKSPGGACPCSRRAPGPAAPAPDRTAPRTNPPRTLGTRASAGRAPCYDERLPGPRRAHP